MKKVTLYPMTEADVEWLEQRLMEYGNDDSMLSLSALDGFLTAVLSGPELVSPSQWWPALWGGMPPEWSSEREMKRALDLIIGHGPHPLLSARALYPCVDGQSFRRTRDLQRRRVVLWLSAWHGAGELASAARGAGYLA